MNWKKAFPLLLLVVLAGVTLVIKQCNSGAPGVQVQPQADDTAAQPATDSTVMPLVPLKKDTVKTGGKEVRGFRKRGLNRNPAAINYSRHARCRMDCRHISEQEVKDILKNGKINFSKSDLKEKDLCKKKYAVEGTTSDNQRVRIIFAGCEDEVTVVTVIDLGKEWVCDCE